ncbi:MAG: acyl-CoA reductase [Oscillospiraceae bacterium]|nr:acyl-CoA reductase [Oscillospiraceae bacterium]
MIFYNGKVYPTTEQEHLLSTLEADINRTREMFTLEAETVIKAADTLGKMLAEGEFDSIAAEFLKETDSEALKLAAEFLRGDNLRFRLKKELGKNFGKSRSFNPPYGIKETEVRIVPLGTLFHIAAGNMDALPAFSVMEGLLTGNVNILKLPQADSGLTIEIFRRLIGIEPKLAPFVYIFDTPSADIEAVKKMAEISDGIAVWGGDEAVSAVRQLAPVGAKLIEWGHRLSFAYISGYSDKDAELAALAEHIIKTKQLLCSSCQTIFIDTEKMSDVHAFCKDFLPCLEAAAEKFAFDEIGSYAEMTLRRYTDRLEGHIGTRNPDRTCFNGRKCSLTACSDSIPELSYMYGNVLVKPLPREKLLHELRKVKGYLQTAGLICRRNYRDELTDILIRAGVNRVMASGNMSVTFCGEAHDGEYPLRRYMRVVNVEI